MKIEFNQKEYRNLVRAVGMGNVIYGILGDMVDRRKYKKTSLDMHELQDKILSFARDFSCGSLVDEYDGKMILSDEWSEKIFDDSNYYDEETFWHELVARLGKRDFFRDIRPEEREYIINNAGWLPNRIYDFYEKWEDEFDEHNLERLDVVM